MSDPPPGREGELFLEAAGVVALRDEFVVFAAPGCKKACVTALELDPRSGDVGALSQYLRVRLAPNTSPLRCAVCHDELKRGEVLCPCAGSHLECFSRGRCVACGQTPRARVPWRLVAAGLFGLSGLSLLQWLELADAQSWISRFTVFRFALLMTGLALVFGSVMNVYLWHDEKEI